MRDFFIGWLEKILNVMAVIVAIALVLGSLAAMFGGGFAMGPMRGGGGVLGGLLLLVFGAIYYVIFFGFAYLGLGIYQNTKASAAALEKLAAK